METIRAFIAIDIGDEIRGCIDELQRILKKVHADVRWVRPCNIHLTLAFLGELPTDRLEPLKASLEDNLSGETAFELSVTGTGFFGRPDRPRVIWAGIDACPPLSALHRKTAAALKAAGLEPDTKPFAPHLTLGRVKSPNHTASLLAKLDNFQHAVLGKTVVNETVLYRSTLRREGAEYTALHRIPLSG